LPRRGESQRVWYNQLIPRCPGDAETGDDDGGAVIRVYNNTALC